MIILVHIQDTAWYMVGTLNLSLWQEGHLWSWILEVKKSGDENFHFWGHPRYSLACADNGCGFCRAGQQHQHSQHNGIQYSCKVISNLSQMSGNQSLKYRASNQNCYNWLTTEVSAPVLYFSISCRDKYKKKNMAYTTQKEKECIPMHIWGQILGIAINKGSFKNNSYFYNSRWKGNYINTVCIAAVP